MRREEHNGVLLRCWIAMVEVEYDNVRLAAVDARMSS